MSKDEPHQSEWPPSKTLNKKWLISEKESKQRINLENIKTKTNKK
jgi:hypothetical protein